MLVWLLELIQIKSGQLRVIPSYHGWRVNSGVNIVYCMHYQLDVAWLYTLGYGKLASRRWVSDQEGVSSGTGEMEALLP